MMTIINMKISNLITMLAVFTRK